MTPADMSVANTSAAHVNSPDTTLPQMNKAPALSVKGLCVEFRTRSGIVRALDNVSFSVDKGETIALVGESGSGKSVTAYAVMGILDPAGRVTAGQAMLGGLDLLSANPSQLAEVR